ncbi:hypothetical protein ACFLWB_00010 [Chloroflexota bacterium]
MPVWVIVVLSLNHGIGMLFIFPELGEKMRQLGIGIFGVKRGIEPPRAAPGVLAESGSKTTLVFSWPWVWRGYEMLITLCGVGTIWFGLNIAKEANISIVVLGILVVLLGIWAVSGGMTVKVTFDQPPGYITVQRGSDPKWLWFRRRKYVISKEEAITAGYSGFDGVSPTDATQDVYKVEIKLKSGVLKLEDIPSDYKKAKYLAERIRDFGSP